MTGALVAGLVAGYGVAVPVGAIAALIVSLTARTSWRVGAAAAMGVATADGVFAVAAVLGGAALARFIEPIAGGLRWLAAGVLIAIAVRTAINGVREHRRRDGIQRDGIQRDDIHRDDIHRDGIHRDRGVARSAVGLTTPGRAYLGLLGLTLLNPATIVYFGALVLGRQAADGASGAGGDGGIGGDGGGDALYVAGQVVFVLAAFAASASWQLFLAGGGRLVGRVLTGARGRLATAWVSSVVMVVLAVALLPR